MDQRSLSREEVLRYSRHLILPEVGTRGQVRLREASVAVVGLGGLGSPVALYLAAAGVGRLGLFDFDRVELSNLQRQIIHGTSDTGRPKVESAAERLADVNPFVRTVLHPVRLSADNALELLRPYDVVVDGTDNFATRYLVNDACVLLGKPNVYGSIFRFEGQATVFGAPEGPCYRCLFPDPPPPGLVPNCAEAGVLGILPGIVGAIQATEAIKWIVGAGTSLVGRLLLFDALAMRFKELVVRRNPACPACGDRPSITSLREEAISCATPAEPTSRPPAIRSISPRELAARIRAGDPVRIVDVREPAEWAIGHLDGAIHIPLRELRGRYRELDPKDEIVLVCHLGARSAHAYRFLEEAGFGRLWNLEGGLRAWSREVDPALPDY